MKKHYIISNIIIVFILLGLTALTFSFYGSSSVMAKGEEQPYYKGASDRGGVALMINVYWGNENIAPMLDTLDKYGAKCTFFIGGSWANNNPDILAKIAARGHEIANHGYFHKDHDKITEAKNREEIIMCERVIAAHVDYKTNLFAPPSGAFNKTTLKVANSLGYRVIMWSRDTIDWRDKDADTVYSRATKNIQSGDFVLMHPTPHTARALPRILEYYRAHSLSSVTVTSLL